MDWRLARLHRPRPRIAIFVSKYDHCLQDLLYRHQSGEFPCDIPLIISNHPDNQRIADFYRIPYFVLPVTKDNKREVEQKQIALVREHKPAISSCWPATCRSCPMSYRDDDPQSLINIHHSFLPAFVGSKTLPSSLPARSEADRRHRPLRHPGTRRRPHHRTGVIRIYHRDTVDDLIQKGRDIEKVVLSRAVRWHIENRVLLYGNKTVVFSDFRQSLENQPAMRPNPLLDNRAMTSVTT